RGARQRAAGVLVDVARESQLVLADDLGGHLRKVADIGLLALQPGEQVVEVMVVLANRQLTEVAVDLAGLEESTHAFDEGRRDRRCLRGGRGGDGGHAAAGDSTAPTTPGHPRLTIRAPHLYYRDIS